MLHRVCVCVCVRGAGKAHDKLTIGNAFAMCVPNSSQDASFIPRAAPETPAGQNGRLAQAQDPAPARSDGAYSTAHP